MRTLFLLNTVPPPRIEKRIRAARELSEVFVVYWDKGDETFPVIEEAGRVRILIPADRTHPMKRLVPMQKFRTRALEEIRKIAPDVIQVQSFDTLGIACAYGNARILYEVPDIHRYLSRGGRFPKNLFSALLRAKERTYLKRVDHVLITSEAFRPHFTTVPDERITFLPNVPDLEVFRDFEKQPHDGFVVGAIGGLRYLPELHALIDALDETEAKLFFAGFESGTTIRDRVKDNPRVTYTGPYSYERDAKRLYAGVDLIYSVYDATLENVRIALPNKLYEAIKMAPVAAALRDAFETKIVLTGQHEMARGVLEKLPPVYRAEKPDMVLVHGDTSTSFFAGLAAFYERIPVAHVEAGLRTYNRYEPYPEEFNRQAISSLAELHFAPTERAKEHLLDEHIDPATIFVTGNTVIDALMTHVEKNAPADKRKILVTMHRRENVGERMASAFRAFRRIVDDFDIEIVYPVHPSPAVRELAKKTLTHPKIHLVEPMNPIEFYRAMNESFFIATDSGGVQEEAPALGKPVLVLRETTE